MDRRLKNRAASKSLPPGFRFQHHVDAYGSEAKLGYKGFVPLFKAKAFDPNG